MTRHQSPNLLLSQSHSSKIMFLKKCLFIAYGNPLRRDDGAGIELARRVYDEIRNKNYEIRFLEFQQLVPEIVNEIADPSITALFFFDCSVQDAVRKIQICSLQPATCYAATWGHHLTPQTLLAIASSLNGPAPPAWLVTIPGYDFGVGEGVSKEVSQLLNCAPEIVTMIIEVMRLRA